MEDKERPRSGMSSSARCITVRDAPPAARHHAHRPRAEDYPAFCDFVTTHLSTTNNGGFHVLPAKRRHSMGTTAFSSVCRSSGE